MKKNNFLAWFWNDSETSDVSNNELLDTLAVSNPEFEVTENVSNMVWDKNENNMEKLEMSYNENLDVLQLAFDIVRNSLPGFGATTTKSKAKSIAEIPVVDQVLAIATKLKAFVMETE